MVDTVAMPTEFRALPGEGGEGGARVGVNMVLIQGEASLGGGDTQHLDGRGECPQWEPWRWWQLLRSPPHSRAPLRAKRGPWCPSVPAETG